MKARLALTFATALALTACAAPAAPESPAPASVTKSPTVTPTAAPEAATPTPEPTIELAEGRSPELVAEYDACVVDQTATVADMNGDPVSKWEGDEDIAAMCEGLIYGADELDSFADTVAQFDTACLDRLALDEPTWFPEGEDPMVILADPRVEAECKL